MLDLDLNTPSHHTNDLHTPQPVSPPPPRPPPPPKPTSPASHQQPPIVSKFDNLSLKLNNENNNNPRKQSSIAPVPSENIDSDNENDHYMQHSENLKIKDTVIGKNKQTKTKKYWHLKNKA